ncbi:MAG: hypothetical protein KatS3mg081_0471 [Gemmatimonadales bacterium]|nr:MAG: hypothetical protein KatS3mg081_0471 [Gemmatimonadales bacterium]
MRKIGQSAETPRNFRGTPARERQCCAGTGARNCRTFSGRRARSILGPVKQPDEIFFGLQAAVAGRYSLERQLGRGGMGIVYLARDVALDRPVALKLLPPHVAREPSLRDRFIREARTAAKLSHPHIVPVYAVEQTGEFVFFTMAYVPGQTLGQKIRKDGRLDPGEAARILMEIAWALGYAHSRGVVHRDIKPDNVLLDGESGRVLVSDFGIARVVQQSGITGRGEILGTAEYMSPEQASGEPVDGRSDIYSLGVVAFYMLSGRLPFEGDSPAQLLAQHLTREPPRLTEVSPGIPVHLAQLVDRCLRKSPAERFQSAEELAQHLAAAMEKASGVPAPARALFRHLRQSLQSSLAAYGLLALFSGPPAVAALLRGSLGGAIAIATVHLVVLLAGMASVAGTATRWMRRALKSGYTLEQIRAFWPAHRQSELEERAFEMGSRASFLERGALAAGVLGLSTSGYLAYALEEKSWAGAAFMLGLGSGAVWLVRYGTRKDLVGRMLGRLLAGRAGKALWRLARIGTGRRSEADTLRRGTELAILLAIDDLYRGLPKKLRRRLPNLPATVRKLEQDASRLRARISALEDLAARAEGGPAAAARKREVAAELEIARGDAQLRLEEVIAALETVRLDLLRLAAGTGNVETVTADLAAAREVGEAVSRLLEARAEVESALPPAANPSAAQDAKR